MFAFSLHKAGSTLLNKVLEDLAWLSGIGLVNVPRELFRQGIHEDDFPRLPADFFQPRGYIYGGFRSFPTTFSIPPELLERAALLVRDPRDMLVSMYFSFTGEHPLATSAPGDIEQITAIRRRERERGLSRYVLRHARTIEAEFESYEHLLPQLHVWRYEDIIFDKASWVRELAELFQIDLPLTKLLRIAAKHDVRPERESPDAHVRRVTPGDAAEKLSPRMQGYLDRRFDALLARYGYDPLVESRTDWGNPDEPPGVPSEDLPDESDRLRIDPAGIAEFVVGQSLGYEALRQRFVARGAQKTARTSVDAVADYQAWLLRAFCEDTLPRDSRVLVLGPVPPLASREINWLRERFQVELTDPGRTERLSRPDAAGGAISGISRQLADDLSRLPGESFDAVCSLSALERLGGSSVVASDTANGFFDNVFSLRHPAVATAEEDAFRRIIAEFDRVTRPGGINLHLLTMPLVGKSPDHIPLWHHLLFERAAYRLPDLKSLRDCADLLTWPSADTLQPDHRFISVCAFWPVGEL